jgi:hypothetical protein
MAALTVVSSHEPLELIALSAISMFSLSELGYGYAGVVRWSEDFSPSLDWMLSKAWKNAGWLSRLWKKSACALARTTVPPMTPPADATAESEAMRLMGIGGRRSIWP